MTKRLSFWMLLLATCCLPSAARADVLGIGPGFFIEDSSRDYVFEEGGQPLNEEEDDEYVSDGFFNLSLWYLTSLFTPNLELGGGITWFNSYTLQPDDADEPEDGDICDDTEQCYVVGHLFQTFGQAEYHFPQVAGDMGLFIGGRLGLLVAFPKGDLNQELKGFETQGYDVYPSLPRVGGFLAPLFGARHPLNERLGLRGEFSAQFSRLGLYDAEAVTVGPTLRRASGLSSTRYMFVLGLEIKL